MSFSNWKIQPTSFTPDWRGGAVELDSFDRRVKVYREHMKQQRARRFKHGTNNTISTGHS